MDPKTHIYPHFYIPYLVLITMYLRNRSRTSCTSGTHLPHKTSKMSWGSESVQRSVPCAKTNVYMPSAPVRTQKILKKKKKKKIPVYVLLQSTVSFTEQRQTHRYVGNINAVRGSFVNEKKVSRRVLGLGENCTIRNIYVPGTSLAIYLVVGCAIFF